MIWQLSEDLTLYYFTTLILAALGQRRCRTSALLLYSSVSHSIPLLVL